MSPEDAPVNSNINRDGTGTGALTFKRSSAAILIVPPAA